MNNNIDVTKERIEHAGVQIDLMINELINESKYMSEEKRKVIKNIINESNIEDKYKKILLYIVN